MSIDSILQLSELRFGSTKPKSLTLQESINRCESTLGDLVVEQSYALREGRDISRLRREILSTMRQFSRLKAREKEKLQSDLDMKESWQDEISQLSKVEPLNHEFEIRKIEQEKEKEKIEYDKISSDVESVKAKLRDLRKQQSSSSARINGFNKEIAEIKSRTQIQASEKQAEISKFLKARRFSSLPQAKKAISTECEGLRNELEQSEREIESFGEGIPTYVQIIKLAEQTVVDINDILGDQDLQKPEIEMRIQKGLTSAIVDLESFMQTAEKKGWNLMLALIKSEIESLNLALDMMESPV